MSEKESWGSKVLENVFQCSRGNYFAVIQQTGQYWQMLLPTRSIFIMENLWIFNYSWLSLSQTLITQSVALSILDYKNNSISVTGKSVCVI